VNVQKLKAVEEDGRIIYANNENEFKDIGTEIF
jgi:hypothetical protein